jgi:hypothetical protein
LLLVSGKQRLTAVAGLTFSPLRSPPKHSHKQEFDRQKNPDKAQHASHFRVPMLGIGQAASDLNNHRSAGCALL